MTHLFVQTGQLAARGILEGNAGAMKHPLHRPVDVADNVAVRIRKVAPLRNKMDGRSLSQHGPSHPHTCEESPGRAGTSCRRSGASPQRGAPRVESEPTRL